VCKRRKAAVLDAVWPGCRTPPGSESGAWNHRGNAGTWESPLSPCAIPGWGDRVTTGPGMVGGFHATMSPFGRPHTRGSRPGIGPASAKRRPRDGEVAVVAAPRTDAGGEGRPKRPTGGKAPSSRAFQWADTRERLCAHQACHQTPMGRHKGQQRLCLRNRMRAWRTYGSVGGPDG
jgi:hypothetical protein